MNAAFFRCKARYKVQTVLFFFFVFFVVSCLYTLNLGAAPNQAASSAASVRKMLLDKSIFCPSEQNLNGGIMKGIRKVIPQAQSMDFSGDNIYSAFAQLNSQYPSQFGKIAENAVIGMAESINDPYTAVLTKEDMDKDKMFASSGSFSGIGVELAWKGGLMAAGTVPGSPAAKGGLKPGDFITAVDGCQVKGMSFYRAGDLIAGPAGSTASLDIVRQGKKMHLDIVRASLKMPEISGKIIDSKNGIGYIRIGYFSPSAGSEAAAQLGKLCRSGMKGLILDLRGNPGGDFKEGLRTAALFKQGELVFVKWRSGVKRMKNSQAPYFKGRIAVLTDGGTASSAEIVTAALKGSSGVKVFGTKTFGKGLIQDLYSLPGGYGLRMSTGTYLDRNGKAINNAGIAPDAVCSSYEEAVKAACAYLK